MLAATAAAVPASDDWVAEPKWDGFRTILQVNDALAVTMTSRTGRRWDHAFPELADIGRQVGRPVILDGETIVMARGRPNFGHLSRRLHARRPTASRGP
jgi:bifunctional non-homologous end joining protein LigD